MKLLLAIHLVISLLDAVNAAEFGCKLERSGTQLTCKNFHKSFLPFHDEYRQVTTMYIIGDYNKLDFSSAYVNLSRITMESRNLQEIQLHGYSKFPNLHTVQNFEGQQVLKLNLTGIDKMDQMRALSITENKELVFSCNELRLSNLTHVSFGSNHLKTFDFSCVPRSVEILILSENNITTLQSFHSLKNLTSLSLLDLRNNKLKQFNFEHLPKSIRNFNIRVNEISELNGYETLNSLTRLQSIGLENNRLTWFDFKSVPRYGLLYLSLSNNQLSRITEEDCQALRSSSLRKLTLRSNEFQEFDFRCLPNYLRFIALEDNKLTEMILPSTTDPSRANYLERIDLVGNRISVIDEETCENLQSLSKLKQLDLASNQLTEFNFQCLPESMQRLELQNNSLSTINVNNPSRFSSLRFLQVDNNPINCDCSFMQRYVELVQAKNIRLYCPNRMCITCSNNSKLADYPWWTNITRIKEHDDNSNQCFINNLIEMTVSKTSSSLIEGGCRFEKVLGIIPKVECDAYTKDKFISNDAYMNLESLEVKGSFSRIEIDLIYQQLRHIKLKSPALERFDFTTINGFKNLKIVDLSNSHIKNLEFDNEESGLREIYLSNNSLARFAGDSFQSSLPRLQLLFLDMNQLESFDLSHAPVSLTNINLAYNRLSRVYLEDVDKLINLKILNLSGNLLDSFTLDRLPPNLKQLSLKGNMIYNLGLRTPNQLTNLYLDVQNNLINCNCDFFTDYLHVLKTDDIHIYCDESNCLQCHVDSPLASYPWTNNTEQLENYDYASNMCLERDAVDLAPTQCDDIRFGADSSWRRSLLRFPMWTRRSWRRSILRRPIWQRQIWH